MRSSEWSSTYKSENLLFSDMVTSSDSCQWTRVSIWISTRVSRRAFISSSSLSSETVDATESPSAPSSRPEVTSIAASMLFCYVWGTQTNQTPFLCAKYKIRVSHNGHTSQHCHVSRHVCVAVWVVPCCPCFSPSYVPCPNISNVFSEVSNLKVAHEWQ